MDEKFWSHILENLSYLFVFVNFCINMPGKNWAVTKTSVISKATPETWNLLVDSMFLFYFGVCSPSTSSYIFIYHHNPGFVLIPLCFVHVPCTGLAMTWVFHVEPNLQTLANTSSIKLVPMGTLWEPITSKADKSTVFFPTQIMVKLQGCVTVLGVICPFLYETFRLKRVNSEKIWVHPRS